MEEANVKTVKKGALSAETKKLGALVARNLKCYFKDKFLFFISLITPIILFVLFVTFLRNVYMQSFEGILGGINEGFSLDVKVPQRVLDGATGAWLMSSILGVSSVTVAFCSNTIMIDDKLSSAITDFNVSPVNRITVQLSYFIANFLATFLVMVCVMLIGHIYLAAVGWYLSVADVFLILADVIIAILFGTLLAAIVESFISSQGGLSAVSTFVSSMYGFICGAYMPLSQFAEGLKNVLCLLPGTYSVSIIRNHYLGGYVDEICGYFPEGLAQDTVRSEILKSFDAKIEAFGNVVPLGAMYGIALGACGLFLIAFVTLIIVKNKRRTK